MPYSIRLQKYFDEYELSHQNKVNLAIHKVAIPMIIFHIFAMLSWVPLFSLLRYQVTLAEISLVGVFIFYLTLHWRFGLILFAYTFLCIQIAHITPGVVVIGIAIAAWVMQLLGHALWEKKSPSFTQNIVQLLIGPLFVLHLFSLKFRTRQS